MCSMHERLQSFKSANRRHEIEVDVMKKLIKEAVKMRIGSLILIGGEPFLEPRLLELVNFARESGIEGITVVTNGTLFNESVIKNIFDLNLDNLNFSISIDAATEKTFAQIRGENALGKIIENVNLINSIKEKENKIYPNICSVCTIMDQNLEELMDIVKLCRKIKISRLIFQPVVGDNTDQRRRDRDSSVFVSKDRHVILDNAINDLIKYKMQSRDNFDYIANSVKHLQLINSYFKGKRLSPREMPCYAGYNRLQIVQEGKVYFCVNQENHEATYGDVGKDSLKALWFSSKARFYRKLIRKCNFPCLQWCSYRDDFNELSGELQKNKLFKNNV